MSTPVRLWALVVVSVAVGCTDPAVARESTGGRRTRNFPVASNTPEGGWTLVEEMNLTGTQGQTNTTFDYGVFNVWDAGVSVLNGAFYSNNDGQVWDPDLLVNVERYFELSSAASLIVGTALGTRPWDSRPDRLESLTYLDAKVDLPNDSGSVHGGVYYANAALAGEAASAGYLFGLQLPLYRDKLQIQGDYVSGNNNLSSASVIFMWKLTLNLQAGLGVQVAAPTSDAEASTQLGLYWSDLPEPQQPVGQ